MAAATAMHAAPFANSVAVGTEGCAGAVDALEATADSVTLLRLVVAGAQPQPASMLARAVAGNTTATARAERLMAEEGLSFREAHRLVGQALTEATTTAEAVGLDPVGVARAARFGAGPGAPPALDDLRHRRAVAVADLAERSRRWRRADTDLAAAVAALTAPDRPATSSPVLAEAGQASCGAERPSGR